MLPLRLDLSVHLAVHCQEPDHEQQLHPSCLLHSDMAAQAEARFVSLGASEAFVAYGHHCHLLDRGRRDALGLWAAAAAGRLLHLLSPP